MNEFLDNIRGIIIAQIKADKNISRITTELLEGFLDDFRVVIENRRSLTEDEKQILLKELANYFIADLRYENDLVELVRGQSIIDKDIRLHTPWEPDMNRFYWKKQREFLMTLLPKKNGQEESATIINSIDFETETILKNMENPGREGFDSRGLAVGYVQSGKTANFTALISKAADAGYRFVIILAGIHDELRQQTQIRIDRELTGNNNLELEGDFVEWNDLDEHMRWVNLTSAGWLEANDTGEFSGKGINKFNDVFLNRKKPVIAIIKKNVKILTKLIKWVEAGDKNVRKNVPILVVDDEADQASVDGNANKKDTKPAQTNAKIRTLLSLFIRKGYIGYTATPFANVFIKHNKEDEQLEDDLYPRNFIHCLPEPQGYFGTKRIFHDDLDDFFVLEIKDPRKEKKEITDLRRITNDLAEAINTFIVSIAVRNLRNAEDQPMSMMINVDHRVTKMNRVGELVREYVLETLPNHYNPEDIINVYRKLKVSGNKINIKLQLENSYFSEENVLQEAIRIIISKELKIRILNSSKEDKLDYAKEPSMKVIAIGGNKLSRGLTLDGLMTTFYLRESKQFDTLLQMGRWFGYRKGYEDLVRIYTSKILWDQFKDLAVVELEFRDNVKEMVESDKTPKEFSVEVKHVLGLLPTAKNKLGAAGLEKSYGNKQVSVTRLMLDNPNLVDGNFRLTKSLISSILALDTEFKPMTSSDLPTRLARNVPWKIVRPFIENFHIATNGKESFMDFNKDNLIRYIEENTRNNNILNWNVVIVSINQNDDDLRIELPGNITVRAVNRARLKVKPVNGSYYIQALSSKSDRKIDLDPTAKDEYDKRENPLLLIYFISRNSKPTINESTTRENLYLNIENKKRDPVAYSIIFPTNKESRDRWKQQI